MKDQSRAQDVTGLLLSWQQGGPAALDRLIPLVYDELRRVARRQIRRDSCGRSLQATVLVREVYRRLVHFNRLTLKDRTHFFAVAGRVMRQTSGFDGRQCRVVELRFFAGLNIPEVAEPLGVSSDTVERERAMVKAQLYQRLSTSDRATP